MSKKPQGPKPVVTVPEPAAIAHEADAAAKGDLSTPFVLRGADVTSLSTAAIQKRLDHLVRLGLVYEVDGRYYAVKAGDA